MDRTLLARFRGYAIDHIPAAQIIREKERVKEKKDNDTSADAKQYAQKLWDSANANISQCQNSEIELVAIALLLDITSWELYEPSPFLDKLAEVHSGDDGKITREYLESNIYIGVESLNKVTKKNISIISSLVDFKNDFVATIAFNDAVRIADAAKKMGCTVEQLIKEAANSEKILYVALKPHSSKLIAIPSHEEPRTATHTTKCVEIVAMLPSYAELLAVLGSVEIAKYQAGNEPPLDWHYWVLDVPQTINNDLVFIPHSEVELYDTTDKSDCAQSSNTLNAKVKLKGNSLSHVDVFPYPPKTLTEGFDIISKETDCYIKKYNNLPTNIELWKHLKNVIPFEGKDGFIDIGKPMDRGSFYSSFRYWTTPRKKQLEKLDKSR